MKILVSGASIAGPAVAWWLHHRGFTPVLVEKMPGRARGGHAIDVRGAALKVLRGMGCEDAARERRMRMTGVSKLDADGREVWRSEEMTISGGSFGNDDIELLRDDLSNVLVDALPPDIEIIYGDSITALDEDAGGITVSFEKAPPRRFDLVLAADGMRSPTRALAFGTGNECYRAFDLALAPHSAPNVLGLADWQVSYEGDGGSCMVYTAPGNAELRVCFGFDVPLAEVPADRAAQMALVRERCGHLGWEVPRLLDLMDSSPDFYLGAIAQVKLDRWSQGRVALVGDAGYCPSPFTGQGATLALVGAYVLAEELAASPGDHGAAFARYEQRLRPFVEINHAIADISRDPRFGSDPSYYPDVVEPAMDRAKNAIELPALS